jgi:hypothetical protein
MRLDPFSLSVNEKKKNLAKPLRPATENTTSGRRPSTTAGGVGIGRIAIP